MTVHTPVPFAEMLATERWRHALERAGFVIVWEAWGRETNGR